MNRLLLSPCFRKPLRLLVFWLALPHACLANMNQPHEIACDIGGGARIVVVHPQDGQPAAWYLDNKKAGRQKLGSALSAFAEVDNLLVSTDKKYLAVLSAAEGQPTVEIIGLNELVNHHGYKVILEIIPTYGGIGMERWEGDNLIVSSGSLLTWLNGHPETPPIPQFDEPKEFLVETETGRVLPHGWTIGDAALETAKKLNHPSALRREDAVISLRELGSPAALPYLKKALESEKDALVKGQMQEAINAIENAGQEAFIDKLTE